MRNNDHLDMFSYRALNIMFIKISQFHVFVHKKLQIFMVSLAKENSLCYIYPAIDFYNYEGGRC